MESWSEMFASKKSVLRGGSLVAALLLPLLAGAKDINIRFQGLGAIEGGNIINSTDTLGENFNGATFFGARTQVTAVAEISEAWEGAMGIGGRQILANESGTRVAQGELNADRKLTVGVEPYITQARITFTRGEKLAPSFQATLGYFPYSYNSDVKNLGLYLLRGTVYPSILFSGFEQDETIGLASQLGARLHSTMGAFSHDIILSSETDTKPLFDYSLAYIGKYSSGGFFKGGAGINFYRYLSINNDLTTPRDKDAFPDEAPPNEGFHPYSRYHMYVDPVNIKDTTRFTLKGIKVNGFFSMDFKSLLGGIEIMGEQDLKLYSEFALIGIQNYKGIYDNRMNRLPVMMGFNIPAFNLLDHFSLEVEWFGAPWRDDYQKVAMELSPIPVSDYNIRRIHVAGATPAQDSLDVSGKKYAKESPYSVMNIHTDDIKWSIHAAKTFKGHIRFSGQVANDHFRTGGNYLNDSFVSAFSTLEDWYVMAKLSYFF